MTRDSHRILIASAFAFWLGLMFAPAVLAEEHWQELEHPSLDALFVSARQAHVSYTSAKLENVSVWFPGNDVHVARHAEDLRRRTTEHFEAAIAAHELILANGEAVASGDNIVVIRVQLIDLRSVSRDSDTSNWANKFRFRAESGRVTLVAELIDAATGATLLRMADLQDPSTEVDRILQQWGEIVALNVQVLPGSLQLAQAR